jgi:hypothetical protein
MKLPRRPWTLIPAFLVCLGVGIPAHAWNSGGEHGDADLAHGAAAGATQMVSIPGPLRSFMRMAGISQEATPEEMLPLLARNVSLHGYQVGSETEYLVLLRRYVQFAQDLRQLADAQNTIHVDNCEEAAKLVEVLGYQFDPACGEKNAYLVTANAERAFLAIDSGFPLTGLEDALQKHTPFTYSFPATQVPVLFRSQDWTSASLWRHKGEITLVDAMLHDQELDRLYWALSKNDEETRLVLRQSRGLRSLLPLAPALEFYGSQVSVRAGRVLVPGGPDAEKGWEELVGASPNVPGEFIERLCARDHGWLAAYFDALSRVSHEQQVHLTSGSRLKQLYDVYRRAGNGFSATRGVFPRNADLLVLFNRMQWQPDGSPYVPGSLAVWKEILGQNYSPKLVRDWVRDTRGWDSPEQLLMTLVASSCFTTDVGPLQIYLTLSAIDHARPPEARLSEATVRLLASKFTEFHSGYLGFSEFPTLNDTSVTQFLNAAESVSGISSPVLRSNAMGALQGNIGLWEILARQQQIPEGKMNASWQGAVQPFIGVSASGPLFEATRASLRSTLGAASGEANLSQDQVIELLAGPAQQSFAGRRTHDEIAQRMRSVLDDQRLVSLDTLFGLYDGLDQMAHGSAVKDQLLPLAGSLREFEMPRAIFSPGEKAAWAPQIYTSRHAELQVRTDLTRVIQSSSSPAQLEAARGQLTPFLRDTLVGLNYAYYEPPGAQVLHNNPLFVRSHDFSGASILGYGQIWDSPSLVGIGVTAGGGAYLIGSLANLPYALATAEEDFIAPENVQALIWQAAGPALLVDAIQPRWWDVSPAELHAAALYQRMGEELLMDATGNAELRGRVKEVLSDLMMPRRLEMTEQALQHPADAAAFMPQITPAEKFYLASEYRRLYPEQAASWGAASKELDELARSNPSEVSVARLSKDFGVPHPTLEQTNACAIMNVKPLPAFSGEDYGLVGESWESSNLYWARLADEMGYPAVSLNLLIPELSRHMIAKIFATDIEDWPAILRAMEQTGDEFRCGGLHLAAASTIAQH